ncbi:MAG TPA: hypothetical protein VFV58_07020, partial [Blastocatellia bacterium]|nr:hypothetical protein [Blastocatellia bacterium]
NFYPPLFYWLIAILHHTHLVSFTGSFKLVLATSVLLLPVAIWMMAWAVSQKNRLVAASAACAVLPLLVDKRFFYPLGLGHASTFLVGLYSHPLGFVLLIAWYVVYLKAHMRKWRFVSASLLLALASLSNFFVAITGALFVAATIIIDLAKYFRATGREERFEARRAFIAHVITPLIAAGLASFWLFPMLDASEYLVSRPYTGPFNELIPPVMFVWYAISLIGIVCWARRPTEGIAPFLASLSALAVSVIASSLLPPRWSPFQAPRFLVTLNFLLAVPVGVAVASALNKLRTFSGGAITRFHIAFGIPSALLISLLIWVEPPSYGLAFFPTNESERIDSVLRFAQEHHSGRYLVEVPPFSRPGPALDGRALNSYLGLQDNEALSLFFREASPNIIFFNSLANAFSAAPDNYGFSSILANDLDFIRQPLRQHLNRARLVGVKYLVIFTPQMKDRLSKETEIEARHDFGAWTVFALRGEPAPSVRKLDFRPALVVSKFSLKQRRSDESDFVRWAEEQFADGWFDVLLARSPETKIDRLQELDQFGALILDTYDCADENLAFERLRSFAQQRALILLSSDSTLFRRIRSAIAQFPLAEIIERIPSAGGDWLGDDKPKRYGANNIHQEWLAIRRILEQMKTPAGMAASLDGEVDQKTIRLKPGALTSTSGIPMLINTTYHPNWRRDDGGAIYAASPFFMLTFIRQPTQIIYARNWFDRAGLMVSVSVLIIFCFGVLLFRKKAG